MKLWKMGKVQPPYKASLVTNLRESPARLRAGIAGLTSEELELAPEAGKWSSRKCVEHIVSADLGWTDILYEAVCPYHPHLKQHEPGWQVAREKLSLESVSRALGVMEENHHEVIAYLEQLPESSFDFEHRPVQWLVGAKIPFVIKESVNWGLSVHVDWHLIHIHRKRVLLGKPLAWMAEIRTE